MEPVTETEIAKEIDDQLGALVSILNERDASLSQHMDLFIVKTDGRFETMEGEIKEIKDSFITTLNNSTSIERLKGDMDKLGATLNKELMEMLNAEVENVMNDKADLIERLNAKADKADLLSKVDESDVAALQSLIASKLDAKADLTALQKQSDVLDTKADKSEFISLQKQLDGIIQKQSEVSDKINTDELISLQKQLDTKVDKDTLISLQKQLDTKVDKDTLISLQKQSDVTDVVSLQKQIDAKADKNDLIALQSIMFQDIDAKVATLTKAIENLQKNIGLGVSTNIEYTPAVVAGRIFPGIDRPRNLNELANLVLETRTRIDEVIVQTSNILHRTT